MRAHDLHGHALVLTDQAEQDVLGADVVVVEPQRLAERELQHLLGPWRERDVPALRLALARLHLLEYLFADGVMRHPELFEDAGHAPDGLLFEALGLV